VKPESEASPVSGTWLLRDLPHQKPQINLLTHEEAQRIPAHLIERGYLLGPADGKWGPRSQAALEDFRRAQGLPSKHGWKPSPSDTQIAQASGVATEQSASIEHTLPPNRPTELSKPIGALEANESAEERAELRDTGQGQQIDGGEPYIGAWVC
jgi:peptidoglycan hydrolase-like protein with peptidoglycan-binding domain